MPGLVLYDPILNRGPGGFAIERGYPLDVRAKMEGTRRLTEVESLQLEYPGGTIGPPTSVTLRRYLPEEFPIPGAIEFQRNGFANLAGAGSAVTLLRYDNPSSSYGIVRALGGGVDSMTAVTDVTFSLRVNGAPVPGWGQWRLFPGPAARVSGNVDTWVLLWPGDVVELVIINTDGALYTVGGSFSGWSWAVASDVAWRGAERRAA